MVKFQVSAAFQAATRLVSGAARGPAAGSDRSTRRVAPGRPPLAGAASPASPDLHPAVPVAALLLAALFWGAGNVANKTLLAHIGPLTALSLRCLFAFLLLLPLLRLERERSAPGWFASALLLSGLSAGAMLFQQLAYLWTTVTNISFLVNTCTVMTPILAYLFLRDRVSVQVALAAVLTVAGAFLMSGASAGGQGNLGDLMCLISALFYAAWMVALGRHAMAFGRPLATTLVQFAIVVVWFAPLAALLEAPTARGVMAAMPEIAFLAVFATAGAIVLTAWAQRHVAASVAVVLVSAESVFGALGAWALLGERLSPSGLLGAGLILGAILLVAVWPRGRVLPDWAGRPTRRKRRARREPGPVAAAPAVLQASAPSPEPVTKADAPAPQDRVPDHVQA